MVTYITLKDIKQKFNELIAETKSREEIANWANEKMQDEDLGRLVYLPQHDEKEIWDGILYLTGVDLKVTPDLYLHCTTDFINYLNTISKQ